MSTGFGSAPRSPLAPSPQPLVPALHIELTDALRCLALPAHAEQYLVLLPQEMEGRLVVRGDLGCPVCGRVVRIVDGVADFGGGVASNGTTALTAEAVLAFLGISGPGGYVALVGGVTSLADELGKLLPDVGLVLINPPSNDAARSAAGVLRAGRLPLKTGSMRGVVLGAEVSTDRKWVTDAISAVLPGLRVVGEGSESPEGSVELLAQSPACWVGKKSTAGSHT